MVEAQQELAEGVYRVVERHYLDQETSRGWRLSKVLEEDEWLTPPPPSPMNYNYGGQPAQAPQAPALGRTTRFLLRKDPESALGEARTEIDRLECEVEKLRRTNSEMVAAQKKKDEVSAELRGLLDTRTRQHADAARELDVARASARKYEVDIGKITSVIGSREVTRILSEPEKR